MSMYITFIDQGNYNMVVSAQRDNAFLLPNSSTIEVQDSQLFTAILEALAERKTIKFHKEVETLTRENLEIDDTANVVKNSYIFQLCARMSEIFTRIPQYNYFRYIYLNNVFASRGIFITEENREEKYIEILELDDENLINLLEEYLKVMNQLNQYEKMYQEFLNALDSMETTDDEEMLNQILQETFKYFTNVSKNFAVIDWKGWFSTVKGKMQDVKPIPTEANLNTLQQPAL